MPSIDNRHRDKKPVADRFWFGISRVRSGKPKGPRDDERRIFEKVMTHGT
jgi:hypothetical protein